MVYTILTALMGSVMTLPDFTIAAVVDVPLDHASDASGYWRWAMTTWCEDHAARRWTRQWLAGDEIARFHFACSVDAVAFKLRFADLFA